MMNLFKMEFRRNFKTLMIWAGVSGALTLAKRPTRLGARQNRRHPRSTSLASRGGSAFSLDGIPAVGRIGGFVRIGLIPFPIKISGANRRLIVG